MSQTFTRRFEDPAGAAHVQRAGVWFTASFLGSAANSCLVSSDRPMHRRNLVTDAGTAWVSAALGPAARSRTARARSGSRPAPRAWPARW